MSIPRFSTDRDDHHRRSRNVIAYHVVAAGLLCLLLVSPHAADAQCPCVTQASGFAGGDGSPGDPYQVCSPAHLDNVRNHLSSHFVQTADIDMTGVAFMPIGDNVNRFAGNFDGKDFSILNLHINLPGVDFVGLFSWIDNQGTVSHLRLVNQVINARSSIGGLAGSSAGTIISVRVINSDTLGSGDRVGGLIGENNGTISQSMSTGSVGGMNFVGGLVASTNEGSVILDSYSEANVVGSGGFVMGGLAGSVFNATVEKT